MRNWEGTSKPTPTAAFGNTAGGYASHRLGFPESMYDAWQQRNILRPNPLHILDLGTGTGTLARSVARLGHHTTGADIDPDMLGEARRLAEAETLAIDFIETGAEATGLEAERFDLVTAGQCWHWFDRPAAAEEAKRLLKPAGSLMICHYDWLPEKGSVVEMTETLILEFNPEWRAAGGTGVYPHWFGDLSQGGFEGIQSFSYDEPALYTPEGWVSRIEASAGIAALDTEKRMAFKSALAQRIARDYAGDILQTPHRVFCVWGTKSN